MQVDAKILVTGATGTNGREIVRQLTARGIAVRTFVRGAGRVRWDTPLAQETEGDLSDGPSLERAMVGIEKVFAISPLGATAVRLCENVIIAAKRAGIRHLVRLSALGADRRSGAEILRQHGEVDAMLAASDLRYTILRPNAFFQNLLASAPAIKEQGRLFAAVGEAKLSLVDVRDIAEAAVRVLTEPNHEGRSYALTGPESLSYRDLARELTRLLTRPIVYQPVTPAAVEQALCAAGVDAWQAHAVAEIQGAFADGAFAKPTENLGALLARPPHFFADFLRDHAAAFR